MQGWRTILVGAGIAAAPSLLTYLGGVDWTTLLGPNLAMALAGAVTIGMRVITTTPVGTPPKA